MLARVCTFFRKKRILLPGVRPRDAAVEYVKSPAKYMFCQFTREEAINVLSQLDQATQFPCTIYFPRITQYEEVDNLELLKTGIPGTQYPELYTEREATGEEMFLENPLTGGLEFNGKAGLQKFVELIQKEIHKDE